MQKHRESTIPKNINICVRSWASEIFISVLWVEREEEQKLRPLCLIDFRNILRVYLLVPTTLQNKEKKLIHFTYFSAKIYQKMICYGKDNKTKKGKEMIKDNNRRVLKF